MKNLLFLSGFVLMLSFGSCAVSPGDYNTAVMKQVRCVITEVNTLSNLLQQQNFAEIPPALEKGKEQLTSALSRLEGMSAFRGDDGFRQAAVDFVKFYVNVFSNQEVLDLLKRGEPFTEEEGTLIPEVLLGLSTEGAGVKKKLIDEQAAFVGKYDLLRFNYLQP